MKALKIRLRFTAPLHIAARGVGYERVSWIVNSDTLASAILTVWGYLDPEAPRNYAPSPPFRLSSAFPYSGELEFYPKPLAALPIEYPVRLEKDFSKIQFIEAGIFEKLLKGEKIEFSVEQTHRNGRFWVGERKLSDDEPILTEIETGRVVIDRITQQAMNYFISELHFTAGAGLFFWVRFQNPEIRNNFFKTLRLLGEEGLGLDRNCGKGQFTLEEARIGETDLPGPAKEAERFLTLSLYHPDQEEINKGITQDCAYELTHREGYISGSPYRRRLLTMFNEGSVFSGNPEKDYGDSPMVLDPSFPGSTIDHPVYRYGHAFPVGIQ